MVAQLVQEVVVKAALLNSCKGRNLKIMKIKTFYILIFFSTIQFSIAQESLSELLIMYNERSVPYISVQELAMPKTDAIILDVREMQEYNVSHLKDAIYVGYDEFNIETVVKTIERKNKKIVVYCSLGIRSEDIGEKLKKAGYTNVLNLYGGIFEWKNNGFTIYNSDGEETEKVHTFSKEWSKWLTNGIKISD